MIFIFCSLIIPNFKKKAQWFCEPAIDRFVWFPFLEERVNRTTHEKGLF